MPAARNSTPALQPDAIIHALLSDDPDGLSADEKIEQLQCLRRQSEEYSKLADLFLIEQLARRTQGLREAQAKLREAKELFEKLMEPPQHAAVFLRSLSTPRGMRALVGRGSSRSFIGISEEVDAASLRAGEEVLLSKDQTFIVAKSPCGFPACGETAQFERYLGPARAVVKFRDEELIVDLAAPAQEQQLRSGDLIRVDRANYLAYEKLERSQGTQLFLESTPRETFEQIGGLSKQVKDLKRLCLLQLEYPATVKRYGLRQKRGLLLHGPTGTGKTLLAKALANFLATVSKSGRSRFMNIKPSQLHSMWYSQSEANYREAFRVARQAGDEEPDVPVVMFFDEVDAIGGTRGSSLMRVDDRVMEAFMTELDGLEARGNILVCAATNRHDALDPALVRAGRLGDLVLEVPRPNMSAARDIFAKYLRPGLPYAKNGHGPDSEATRRDIIEACLSRIYAPNADNELVTLTLRDGKRRTVHSGDLISGALIAQIVSAASERACLREIETKEGGLQIQDLVAAIDEEFARTAAFLSPANCRNHLTGLPQDVDVVRVEPAARKAPQAYKYVNMEALHG